MSLLAGRTLASTCNDLRSLWTKSNLHASRRKSQFGHPAQVNAMKYRRSNLEMFCFRPLPVLASAFQPPNAFNFSIRGCLRLRFSQPTRSTSGFEDTCECILATQRVQLKDLRLLAITFQRHHFVDDLGPLY